MDYQIPGPFSFVAYLKYIMEDSTGRLWAPNFVRNDVAVDNYCCEC